MSMIVLPRRCRGALLSLLVVALVTGCAGPAPPAAPSKPAAAPPTTAAAPTTAPAASGKPAAPAAASTTAPASAAQPAAGKPATAGAGTPRGTLVVVVEGEPENGVMPRNSCTLITNFTLSNVYEKLTVIGADGRPTPQLAESYERVNDLTWRFKLRQGVTFSNGEPFNADAVMATLEHDLGPNVTNPGRCRNEYPTLTYPGKKIDDYTVELTTNAPDPLLPAKLAAFKIAAPGWLKATTEEQMVTAAMGTGPYTLVEWQRGGHILLKVNPTYWGPTKPTIAEVRILPRKEASVRAAMVQAGEAHLAFSIPPDQAKQLPAAMTEQTTEMIGVRLNTEHPALKDIRVRQAIAYAIDTKSLTDALFAGFSTPANGQMARASTFGQNPTLAAYPYDPAKAKQLVQEAGAVGAPIELVVREANFARITELGEAITGTVSAATGLKMTPRLLEAGLWRESLFAVKPGEKRSDTLLVAASNTTFDSFRMLTSYYPCGGQFAHACDEAFTAKLAETATKSGPEREQGFRDLWKTTHDNYWVIPLFGLDFVHGTSAKLTWKPRVDQQWMYAEMTLQD